MASFAQQLLSAWRDLKKLSREGYFMIDGNSLNIPQVIAIAQSATRVDMNPDVRDRVSAGFTGLQDHLSAGNVVYGVNTGFGCGIDIFPSFRELC
jgi:histidine ammonia-lyase